LIAFDAGTSRAAAHPAMSISLAQSLQRVRIRDTDGTLARPSRAILAVMKELALAAVGGVGDDDDLYRPIRIGARELARRIGLDDKEARAVRRALGEAVEAGLIRREPPAFGELGDHPPWLHYFHPALIRAAACTRAFAGQPIIFPRPWDLADPDQSPPLHFETWGVKKTGAVKTTRRKGRGTTPPQGDEAQAGARAVGCLDVEVNFDRRRASEARQGEAESVGVTGVGGVGMWATPPGVVQHVHADPRVIPAARPGLLDGRPGKDPQADYLDWLAAGLAAVGWHGLIEFCGQRRKKDGKRGGVIVLVRAHAELPCLASGLAAAQIKCTNYTRPGGRVELSFRLSDTDHPLLLLDDLTVDSVVEIEKRVQAGVAFIETSPGNFQASFMCARILKTDEILFAQRGLARIYGGDKGAVARNQLRRPPGSINSRHGLPGDYFESRLRSCFDGQLNDQFLTMIIEAGRQVITLDKSEQGESLRDSSASGQDFAWLMAQLYKRRRPSDSALLDQLAARAAARGRHGNHTDYAERTLRAALARQATDRSLLPVA